MDAKFHTLIFGKSNTIIGIHVSYLVSVMRRLTDYSTRSSSIQIIIGFGSVLSRNLVNFGSISWVDFPLGVMIGLSAFMLGIHGLTNLSIGSTPVGFKCT